jgi:hypothetical protein
MVKAKEIKHVEPDDAALDEIGESRFSEIVSNPVARGRTDSARIDLPSPVRMTGWRRTGSSS